MGDHKVSLVLFDAPGPKTRRRQLIATFISLILIAAGLVWMIVFLTEPRLSSSGKELPGMLNPARWDIFVNPQLWGAIGLGVLNTLSAALVAAILAVLLGMFFALVRGSSRRWIWIPAAVVLEFLRGMPVLLMMFFILIVASTGAFWAVVLALALYNGALIGEALRAGLVALPRGQREAALSLGMKPMQSWFLVEFPQAFRQMLPIIVAQLVVLLKDTSLGFIVGYNELIRTTMNNLASYYGSFYVFSFFIVTAVIYLAMNLSLSWVARRLARSSSVKTPGVIVQPSESDEVEQSLLRAEAVADTPPKK